MTKEELEKEAEEYVCKRNPLVTKEWFIDAFKKYNKGEKVKHLKDCEIAEYEAYLAGAEPREKRIAELKARLNAINLLTSELEKVSKLRRQQLTKAKELLKQFLEAKNGEDTYKAEWEAEQFLKEEQNGI